MIHITKIYLRKLVQIYNLAKLRSLNKVRSKQSCKVQTVNALWRMRSSTYYSYQDFHVTCTSW